MQFEPIATPRQTRPPPKVTTAGELVANVEPLLRFADLLERHIRTEERKIFPAFQTHVSVGPRSAVEAEVRRILNRPDDQAKVCDIG